ncbi:MAG: hypothetical protein ACFB00_03130 [Parvularculaceae bacterium]
MSEGDDEQRREKRVEKLQIMASDSEITAIDDWRFANRAASRSAAIRSLILLGLAFSASHPDESEKILAERD